MWYSQNKEMTIRLTKGLPSTEQMKNGSSTLLLSRIITNDGFSFLKNNYMKQIYCINTMP